ncbi:NYN domain-containing protein [Arthrobacter sp. I2-34]|uniref:NYN domain-containing protein n=1 Tax=Arthrobacter hankyongi TaxID=2904801 RepID=A0ABS9LCD1_9MICC|nr:NYN domain-containing protein [Arthrobacter hankyongi]MCG2624349.1 NYN domain-containing protein [Arthrobacter hankyongi]
MAIFVDMENLFGGYGRDVTAVPVGTIIKSIQGIVRKNGIGSLTATVRAFANWGRPDMAAYRRELLEHGVEPVQVYSFSSDIKNAADMELVVDALAVAYESSGVEVFVIVSGDGGFVPLIRRLHALGKYVVVATTNQENAGKPNSLLESAADEFHVLDVSGAAADARPRPSGTAVKPANRSPSVEEYRQAVKDLVARNSALRVNGAINGSALGNLLRQKWPSVDYKSFGYRSLGAFVEEYCDLKMWRPASAGAK